MQGIIVHNIEIPTPENAHQTKIGMMLAEEYVIRRLFDTNSIEFSLIADRLSVESRIRSGCRKYHHMMTAMPQPGGELMGVHFQTASEWFRDREFDVRNYGNIHKVETGSRDTSNLCAR